MPLTPSGLTLLAGGACTHSIGIIEPFLPLEAQRNDPAWLSWKKHVEYLTLALAHSFDRASDLPLLSQLVKEHHELYLNVPEYTKHPLDKERGLMKPKNHMATHFSHVISDAGPLYDIYGIAWLR